jgi:hypothetical protein
MHEFSLYGQLLKEDHHQFERQLVGFTRMQPQDVKEVRVVLKAISPPGLVKVQSIGASHLANQQGQDTQRIKTMLSGGLYYVQLIGEILSSQPANSEDISKGDSNESTGPALNATVKWSLEFKDTPDPAKSAVSSRLISRIPMEEGSFMEFMAAFGYELVFALCILACTLNFLQIRLSIPACRLEILSQ